MYFLTLLTLLAGIFSGCNTGDDPNPKEEEPVQPETAISWKATSNDVLIENFSSPSVTGGITPANFSITGLDGADADPITSISIGEQTNPEVKEFTLNSTENILLYTNLSFDNLDSYYSIAGELNITAYDFYQSGNGITQYLMDGTFSATCQDDDSPPNLVEITGSFTDVVISEN